MYSPPCFSMLMFGYCVSIEQAGMFEVVQWLCRERRKMTDKRGHQAEYQVTKFRNGFRVGFIKGLRRTVLKWAKAKRGPSPCRKAQPSVRRRSLASPYQSHSAESTAPMRLLRILHLAHKFAIEALQPHGFPHSARRIRSKPVAWYYLASTSLQSPQLVWRGSHGGRTCMQPTCPPYS